MLGIGTVAARKPQVYSRFKSIVSTDSKSL